MEFAKDELFEDIADKKHKGYLYIFLQGQVAWAEFVIPCELHDYRGYYEHHHRYPHCFVLPDDNADWDYVQGSILLDFVFQAG